MAKKSTKYEAGDWVVHAHHGVGRISGVERRSIGEQENTYFRFEMPDGTIWIPVDLIEGDQIRPLSEKAEFQEAIEVLRRRPVDMDPILTARKNRIGKAIAENSPLATARLVRDLWARQHSQGTLNDSERRTLQELRNHLLHEWALSMNVGIAEARGTLEHTLRNRRQAAGDAVENRRQTYQGNREPRRSPMTREDKKWARWLAQQRKRGL